MMATDETVLPVLVAGQAIVAVLAAPHSGASTAVVVIVGGPQYRAGSHRQFVLLSRRMAQAGYAAVRFDYRGMGDSGGPLRDFEHVSEDVGAVIDALQATMPQIQNVVLWGLCDGASAALLYQLETRDPRVKGLCLLNPWIRSEASLARTQLKHYYLQRLGQREFWNKLFSGKVAGQALRGLLSSFHSALPGSVSPQLRQMAFQDRMARAWLDFKGPILLLLSGNDYTAKEFMGYARSNAAWSRALLHTRLCIQELPGADHTCSNAAAHGLLEDLTLQWLGAELPEPML